MRAPFPIFLFLSPSRHASPAGHRQPVAIFIPENTMKTIKFIAACALLASAGATFSHENTASHTPQSSAQTSAHAAHSGPTAPAQKDWGVVGDAAAVQRTITLAMTDDMRFAPSHITVQEGDTVRLRAANHGQVLHEIVLGTPATLAQHALSMREHPGMAHDAPDMAHVRAGAQGDIVWHFNRPGQFDFACLIPGHFEAGMQGTLTVLPRSH